jgi:hypothetical protein
MNLFIDTNIYLEFYLFSRDDLDELGKLSKLISSGDVTLFVPSQVINELKRNRDSVVSDAYKRFSQSKVDLVLPQICRPYTECDRVRRALRELQASKDALEQILTTHIADKTLRADEVIQSLLDSAKTVEIDPFIDTARRRFDLGNPPGKDGSYGDAVIWEALLASIPAQQDLFFISDDKDYKSPLQDDLFNSFLYDEWFTKKGSRIHFYTQLSEYFRNHYKDIKLRQEEEKEKLIEQLALSGSFSATHALIGKLSQFQDFSDAQVLRLIDVASSNRQIYWIGTDADVKAFFEALLTGRKLTIDDSRRELFENVMSMKL